ncbi:MAG TPA: methyltransferase domain-containing protein [Gemmatimonadales bacterium]|nr:methyltransferase domain-containing protein [Gemmatimonadales bacterium]
MSAPIPSAPPGGPAAGEPAAVVSADILIAGTPPAAGGRPSSPSFEPDTGVLVGAGRVHDTETPDVETASDGYTERRFGGPAGRWLLEEQTRAVDRLLRRTGDAALQVLEVGGGHAQVTPLLVERGHAVVVQGSDPICFKRVLPVRRAHPDRVRGCASDLWALPFADGSFDLVMAVRLLGHVVRWRELLAEMTRVSRRYVIVEFARASALLPLPARATDALFTLKRRVENTTRPFFTYREPRVAAELDRLGFRTLEVVGQFALPMVLHRALKEPRTSAALERLARGLGFGDRLRSPALVLAERRAPES